MEMIKCAVVLVFFILFMNLKEIYGFKVKSSRNTAKHLRKKEMIPTLQSKPRRNSYYPDESIIDLLSKQGINHPASGVILPIFEKLMSGVDMYKIYEPQSSNGKVNADNIAVIRSVSSSAIKVEKGNKARAYFNVSGSTEQNRKYSLNLDTKILCKTTSFQRMKVKFLLRNEKWEVVLKKTASFQYRKICKKRYAMDIINLLEVSLTGGLTMSKLSSSEVDVSFKAIEETSEIGKIQLANIISYVAQSITLLVYSTEENPLVKESKSQTESVVNQPELPSTYSRTLLNGKDLFKLNLRQRELQNSPNHRNKRDIKSNRKNNKPQCQRKDYVVDFETMGWAPWIVFPKAFNSFYCHGRCPSPVNHEFNPTNHALLQSIMRIYDRSIPRPCCSPTKLLPLSMLYYEDGELVVRHHENMIAESCGCR